MPSAAGAQYPKLLQNGQMRWNYLENAATVL